MRMKQALRYVQRTTTPLAPGAVPARLNSLRRTWSGPSWARRARRAKAKMSSSVLLPSPLCAPRRGARNAPRRTMPSTRASQSAGGPQRVAAAAAATQSQDVQLRPRRADAGTARPAPAAEPPAVRALARRSRAGLRSWGRWASAPSYFLGLNLADSGCSARKAGSTRPARLI